MAKESEKQEGPIPEALKDLVIERLDIIPPHKEIHIGSAGVFTKNELIDDETILDSSVGDAVKGKIIYARSCKSAKNLGEDCVRQGADAYLGYKDDFVMFSEPQRNSAG